MNIKRFNKSCLVIILVLVLSFLLILSACDSGEKQEMYVFAEITGPTEILVGEFDLADYMLTVKTADGESKQITVTPDMTTAENTSQFAAPGIYELFVEYGGVKASLSIIVKKDVYDISGIVFEDETVVYDGKEHNLEIKGELPTGVTVTYEGNGQIDAGVYTVTVKFSGDNEKFEAIEDMTATLTIEKRELELAVSGETELIYNEQEQKTINVAATNVIEGDEVSLSVVYSGNMTDVGKYTATIVLEENKNYKLSKEYVIDITIAARKFNVMFVQDGQADFVVAVTEGDPLDINSVKAPVQIPGYTVVWGNADLSCITEDIRVTAEKTPILYDILYVLNGGENNAANPTAYTVESGKIILKSPSKPMATFNGWYATEDFGDETKVSEIETGSVGNITLYAKWTDYRIESAEGFEIDYSGETATVSKTVSNSTINVDLGGSFTVSENCTWKLYADFMGESEYALKSMTLETGENIAYIIVYHLDGEHFSRYCVNIYRLDIKEYAFTDGISELESGRVEETGMINAPQSNPSKNGYDFAGWTVDGKIVGFPYTINESTVFYAAYTPTQYEITYNLNGGSICGEDLDYTIEEDLIYVEPVRDHYIFDGWYEDKDFLSERVYSTGLGSTGEKQLFAKWIPTEYDIEYVLNVPEGFVENPNRTSYNTETPTFFLNELVRKGYDFGGWYLENDFVTAVFAVEVGSYGKLTLYAKWIPRINKIIFEGNGATGGITEEIMAESDSTVILSQNGFERQGYEFSGWSVNKYANQPEYGDCAEYAVGTESTYVLYAVWKPLMNSLTLNGNGATSGEMQDVRQYSDCMVVLPLNEYKKDYYEFAGWSYTFNGEKVLDDGDVYTMGTLPLNTLYAVWVPIVYNINYDLGGGENDQRNVNEYTVESANIALYAAKKEHYDFAGWECDGELIVQLITGSHGDKTLKAVWTPTEYTITYDLSGGVNNVANPDSYTVESDKVLLQDPVRQYYEFMYWQCAGERIDEISSGSYGDITVKAVWKAVEYTVTYELDGGTNDPVNPSVFTVEDLPIELKPATKKDYAFTSWYEEYELVNAVESLTECRNYCLYAEYIFQTEGLKFELIDDGTAYGVSGYDGTAQHVYIREMYNDLPVTAVLTEAFKDNDNILKVVMPSVMTTIEDSAFENAGNLTLVEFSENISYIGNNAFRDCGNLQTADLPDTVTEIGAYAFYDCPLTSGVVLPTSLKSLGSYAYYGGEFTEVVVPVTLSVLGSVPFNISNTKVYAERRQDIPDVLKPLITVSTSLHKGWATDVYGGWTFGYNNVTDDSDFDYVVRDGRAYITAYKGKAEEITIPSALGGYPVADVVGAFEWYLSDETYILRFEDGVTTVSDYLTYRPILGYMQFDVVYIPSSIGYIGTEALAGCSDSIVYCETTQQDVSCIQEDWIDPTADIVWDCRGERLSSQGYTYFENEGMTFRAKDASAQIVHAINEGPSGNIIIPANVVFENRSYNVTTVADSAFYGCALVNVEIENGVTSVGNNAFGCDTLEVLVLPDGITSMAEYAVTAQTVLMKSSSVPTAWNKDWNYGGRRRSSVLLSSSGEYGKTSDGYIWAEKTNGKKVLCRYLGDETELSLPVTVDGETVSEIISYAFYSKHTESIFIAEGVNNIETNAFYNCPAATIYCIEDSEPSGWSDGWYGSSDYVFACDGTQTGVYGDYKWAKLTDGTVAIVSYSGTDKSPELPLTIEGADVSTICGGAFRGCKISEIVIGKNIEKLGHDLFAGGSGVTVYCVDGEMQAGWEEDCFTSAETVIFDYGMLKGTTDDGFEWLRREQSGLIEILSYSGESEEVIIPDCIEGYDVGYLADEMFSGKSNMISVELPVNLVEIPDKLLYNCSSLISVTIPEKVGKIGNYAFYGCSSLTSVSIPDSVKTIGDYTFGNTTLLSYISIGRGVMYIGSEAFYDNGLDISVNFDGTLEQWCEVSFSSANIMMSHDSNPMSFASSVMFGGQSLYGKVSLTGKSIPAGTFTSAQITSLTLTDCNISSLAEIDIPTLEYVNINSGTLSQGYFRNCVNLKTAIVEGCDIEFAAFSGCGALETIAISTIAQDEFPSRIYMLGGLFGNDRYEGATLVKQSVVGNQIMVNTNYYIPVSLKEVKYGYMYLYEGFFENCYNITTLVLTDDVVEIQAGSLDNCGIEEVYYCGAEDDWAKILNNDNSNVVYTDALYFYSEAEPPLNADGNSYEGRYWRYVNGVVVKWELF